MSEPSLPVESPVILAIEIGLWIAGGLVLCRALFGESNLSRPQSRSPSALQPWSISVVVFFQMALCVVMGGWLAQVLVSTLGQHPAVKTAAGDNAWITIQGFIFQLGLLAGVLGAWFLNRTQPPPAIPPPAPPSPRSAHPFLAAVGTFLVALSLVTLIAYVWKTGLKSLGVDTHEQEMVDVFRQADSAKELVTLIVLVVVIAPLTEELVFRAGLFRYLKTRVPRWLALTAPAALFALLHGNTLAFMPLFTLGVIFSLAYERTGRISVTIIAHGLFNLHTILLIMAGVTT